MKEAQKQLYIWLKEVGEVSYERIKQSCAYLNAKFGYSLEKPTHHLFYPLLYDGIVEFSGNGKFCITPECVISKGKTNHIVVNSENTDCSLFSTSIGIQASKSTELMSHKNRYDFNLESILKQIPTVESCVLAYQEVYNIKVSEFVNSNGVSRKNNDSQRHYFIDMQKGKCFVIPHQSMNPDAINIATCYERIIDSMDNGIYNIASKELRFRVRRMPILLYRVLMIECLFCGKIPYVDNGYYVFNNISRKAYFELNRILCNSIKIN